MVDLFLFIRNARSFILLTWTKSLLETYMKPPTKYIQSPTQHHQPYKVLTHNELTLKFKDHLDWLLGQYNCCLPFVNGYSLPTKSCGERRFDEVSPTMWNNLLSALQKVQSLDVFKKYLRIYLFIIAFIDFLKILIQIKQFITLAFHKT